MKLLKTVLIILFPSVIFAQSNYHAGYVVKNNGDTLKGYINYREWGQCPTSIKFKINKDDKQTLLFNPQTIKKLQITDLETYVAYSGLISIDKTKFPDIPEGLDTAKKMDTIFLKQIATGKYLTLFYHRDEIKTRFFIAEANGSPIELIYHQYYNNQKEVTNSDTYKGQLLLYIYKYAPAKTKLNDKAEHDNYEQESLESLVNDINNNAITVKKKPSNRFFVGIAINSTNTQVNDIDNYKETLITHRAVSPKINLGIDIFGNPNVQQFIFRCELSFSYITPRLQYPVTVNTETTADVYSFNQYTAAISPQLLFNVYNKENFKVYIDGGAALNFSTYTNNKFTISNTNTNTGTIQIPKPYNLLSSWINFPIQAGVTLNKKIEISFTYIPYASFTNYSSFYAANESLCLGVKFLLGKD